MGSPVVSMIKNIFANSGDSGSILDSGISLGKGNGNPLQYSCWEIPWMKDPGRLQSKGSQRVGHD